MAVVTTVQCDWLSLLTNEKLIPVSALVAILLFITRELLDWYRKSKTRKNEIRALKQIFARECQLAWSINQQIKKLCAKFAPYEKDSTDKCPLNFGVAKTSAGKIRYTISENGTPRSGGTLSEPSVATFTKYLYEVAKLDPTFYGKVNLAYAAVIELKHLHHSLVDNEDTSREIGIDNIMLGFSGYALKELVWTEQELKSLYQYCTDKELTEGLLR